MDKKRLQRIEKNVHEISSKYDDLLNCFNEWKQATNEGNERKAWDARQKADHWFYDDNNFNRLAYSPPDDADVKGLINGHEWLRFVKYPFNVKRQQKFTE